MVFFRRIEGESRHPGRTATVVRNQSHMLPLKHPCRTPNVARNTVSYAAVEEDCTGGLVIAVYDDSDKGGADVVFLHSCPLCRVQTIKFKLYLLHYCINPTSVPLLPFVYGSVTITRKPQ